MSLGLGGSQLRRPKRPDEIYVYVQSAENVYSLLAPKFDEPKPEQLSSVPNDTWNELQQRIGPLAGKLYLGTSQFKIRLILTFALAVECILYVTAISYMRGFSYYLMITLVSGLTIFVLGLMIYPDHKNQGIDNEISVACKEFEADFASHGFSLNYRTRWTGTFCKARIARPERILVFRRLEGFSGELA